MISKEDYEEHKTEILEQLIGEYCENWYIGCLIDAFSPVELYTLKASAYAGTEGTNYNIVFGG